MPSVDVKIPRSFYTSVNKLMDDMNKFNSQVQQMNRMTTKMSVQQVNVPQTQIVTTFKRLSGIFNKLSAVMQRSIDVIVSAMGTFGKYFVRGLGALGGIVGLITGPVGWLATGTVIVFNIATAAAAFATSVGKWVWDKMVGLGDSMLKDYLLSSGTFSSIGGLRSFRTTFGGLPQDPAMIGNIAMARADIASRQFLTLRLMGIKNQRDTVDMMVEATLAAAMFMRNQPKGLDLVQAEAWGLTAVFPPEYLTALRDLAPMELKHMAEQYYANKEKLKISDKAVHGWIDFRLQVTKMWAHVEVIIAKKLTDPNSDFVTAINNLSKGIENFVKQFMDIVFNDDAIRTIKGWINDIEWWIESGEAKKIFWKAIEWIKNVIRQLDYVGKQLVRMGNVFTGVIITPAKAEEAGRGAGPTFRPGIRYGGSGVGGGIPAPGPTFRPGVQPGLGPHAGPTYKEPGIRSSPRQPAMAPRSSTPGQPAAPTPSSTPRGPGQPTPFVSNVPRGVVQPPSGQQPLGPIPRGGIRKYTGPQAPRIHAPSPVPNAQDRPGTTNDTRTPGPSRLGAQSGAEGVQGELGVSPGEWDAYRQGLADIESSGGKYGLIGGAGNHYSGAYQFGSAEIRDTARQLGEPPPSRDQFLRDPEMQERYLAQYTLEHHKYLMKNPKYAAMSPREKLGVLGYAHNQGPGGANRYLNTGREGRDAFGTSGAAYPKSINRRLNQLDNQGTTGAPPAGTTVTPSRPISGQLLPWPGATTGVQGAPGGPGGPAPVRPSPPTAQSPSSGAPTAPQTAIPDQSERPDLMGGEGEMEGYGRFHWGSGGPRAHPSIPYGDYPITPSTIGPWGSAHGAIGINNNKIWDSKIGRYRDGIEIHSGDGDKLDRMHTAGCFAIAQSQWPSFRKHLLAEAQKGPLYLHVRPDGFASINHDKELLPAASDQSGSPKAPQETPMKPIPPLQYPGWTPTPAQGAPGTPSGPTVTPEQRAAAGSAVTPEQRAAGQKPVMYGFKGVGGAFDQKAFEKYAQSKGYEPVTINAIQPQAAAAEAAADNARRGGGHFGAYGFSLGAQSANSLLSDPNMKSRADVVTVIGPYKSANLSNLTDHPNLNVYPDFSSGNIKPQGEGVPLTGTHMSGPGTVAALTDPGSAAKSPTVQPIPKDPGVATTGKSLVEEAQSTEASTRIHPIQQQLKDKLDFAASQTGVRVKVTSGGQPAAGPHRTGSHRHDLGGAADLELYDQKDGHMLDMRDPADAARMREFTKQSVRAGATGVGAGLGYMGANRIHIGGGNPATWGGADWIRPAWEEGRSDPASPKELQDRKDQIDKDTGDPGSPSDRKDDPGKPTEAKKSTDPATGDKPDSKPGEEHPGFKQEPVKKWPDSKKSEDTKKNGSDAKDSHIAVTNHGSPHKDKEEPHDNGGSLDHGVKVENHSDNDVKVVQ